jgi:hypothetical protein
MCSGMPCNVPGCLWNDAWHDAQEETATKPTYEQAWDILKEVDDHLAEEKDAKGELKNNGEARALNRMKNTLEREISTDATEFLKAHGYNGYGLKKRKKR